MYSLLRASVNKNQRNRKRSQLYIIIVYSQVSNTESLTKVKWTFGVHQVARKVSHLGAKAITKHFEMWNVSGDYSFYRGFLPNATFGTWKKSH